MSRFSAKKHARMYGFAGFALLAIISAVMWKRQRSVDLAESIKNYELHYNRPVGWRDRPRSPQALFFFEDPKTKVTIRGAHNQVVAEFNPTPDWDTDSVMNDFADITRNNLGWKATLLDSVDCTGGSYRLIRRETVDRTIISAIAVKGNTTILINLAGIGLARKRVDEDLAAFRDFLASTSLQLTKM